MTSPTRPLPEILLITGTDTEIGKTISTAALAAVFAERGEDVVVVKPTQTGVQPGDDGDVALVARLAGIAETHEFVRCTEPMAPRAAARIDGVPLPSVADHAARIRALRGPNRRILVEGAGGLLVEMDGAGRTMADLAAELGDDAATVVVCRAGLGTLNHTALVLEAMRARRLRVAGLIIGAWPDAPSVTELDNREMLAHAGAQFAQVPLWGALPRLGLDESAADAPPLDVAAFRALAAASLPRLG